MRGQTMETNISELKLKHIAKKYLSFFTSYSFLNFPSIKSYSLNFNLNFLSHVELAFQSLSSPLKLIINNDFFYQDYPGWWKKIYTWSEYQSLKRKAIKTFMENYYAINN